MAELTATELRKLHEDSGLVGAGKFWQLVQREARKRGVEAPKKATVEEVVEKATTRKQFKKIPARGAVAATSEGRWGQIS